mgnify:CR=1
YGTVGANFRSDAVVIFRGHSQRQSTHVQTLLIINSFCLSPIENAQLPIASQNEIPWVRIGMEMTAREHHLP